MSDMGDLLVFFNARLDETELRAAEVHSKYDCDLSRLAYFGNCSCGEPDRILREVKAMRAILGLHHPTQPHPEMGFTYPAAAKFCGYDGPGDNWQAEREPDFFPDALWPCLTVRLLGAVWSGHPGYRDEWKP